MSAVVADVLDAAAEYLDEHGWRQGELGPPGGRRCAYGALCSATRSDVVSREAAVDVVVRYLGVESLIVWNDEDVRNAGEVIDVFRHAAKVVRDR